MSESTDLVPVKQAIVVHGRPILTLTRGKRPTKKYWFSGEKHIKLRGGILQWEHVIDKVRNRESLEYGPEPEFEKAVRAKVNEFYLKAKGAADGQDTSHAKVPTLREWYLEYREGISPFKKGGRNDNKMLAFVTRYANKRLGQITQMMCRAWIGERLHTRSNRGTVYAESTVRLEGILLQALFAAGILEKKLTITNPWIVPRGAKQIKILPEPLPRERWLTHAEQAKLMPELCRVRLAGGRKGANRFRIDHTDARWATVIIGSGVRHQELMDLSPAKVVDGELDVVGKGRGKGKQRYIGVGDEVVAALDAQRAARGLNDDSTARLWTGHYTNLNKRLTLACERAGIPHVTLHDLRRTYGYRAAREYGIAMIDLRDLMGHADISTTAKYYVPENRARLKGVAKGIHVTVAQSAATDHATPPQKLRKTGGKTQ